MKHNILLSTTHFHAFKCHLLCIISIFAATHYCNLYLLTYMYMYNSDNIEDRDLWDGHEQHGCW